MAEQRADRRSTQMVSPKVRTQKNEVIYFHLSRVYLSVDYKGCRHRHSGAVLLLREGGVGQLLAPANRSASLVRRPSLGESSAVSDQFNPRSTRAAGSAYSP